MTSPHTTPALPYQVKTNGSYTNTQKYYSLNGAMAVMRENGVVTWLLQDQVNSTTGTGQRGWQLQLGGTGQFLRPYFSFETIALRLFLGECSGNH